MRSTPALTLLLVLLAGGVGYWVWTDDTPSAGLPAAATRGAGAQGAGDAVTEIRLDLLERDRGALTASERNPFRFERRMPPPSPVRMQSARRAAPPVDEGLTEPPLPPPPPPPIPLRFIGYLQPRDAEGGRVAVLSDGRGNVFNGKEGDVIEGRYRLLRVGNDSAELVYLDGRGRQTIRLSGQ